MDRWAFGLDLGQTTDYSALSLIHERAPTAGELAALPEKQRRNPEPIHDVPYLHRWELNTSYPTIVGQAVARLRQVVKRERGALVYIVVDGTGVGRPVVDMVADAMGLLDAELVAVTITGGDAITYKVRDDGTQEWHVPKKELVGAAQVLLQGGRLNVAPRLEHAQTLAAEFKNFRMKFTASANAQYEAWRDGDHDDLVLAVALPAWSLLYGPLGQPFEAAVGGQRPNAEYR